MAKEYFWGGKLTEKEKSLKWDPESEYADEDESQDDDITHYLFLKQAVLGVDAKEGERNVIEVQTANFDGDIITQPLLSLKVGLNESTQLDIGLQPPVTFKLALGTGPVYLTGQHALELQDDDDFDDGMDDFKDDSNLLANEAEEGEEDEDDDDEEDEEDDVMDASPEKKQVAGAKDKKKMAAAKKEIKKEEKIEAEAAGKGKKRPAPSSSGAAKKMALGDDDEDEEGDSEDDDEDEDMDEDEEDEEEDSSPEKPAKKTKGKVNGTTKSKEKETPKQAQGKQKGKKEKKISYSVDDVKADLLNSPSKPKKEEKFTNYVKSRYHMTDSKKVQELWGWYKRTQLK